MMKYRFHIRNHWTGWHSDRWYLFGVGYCVQGYRLTVWQLWVLGFCLCLFVDGEAREKRPFPQNWYDWKIARRRRQSSKTK
jgi:hypothetical protein